MSRLAKPSKTPPRITRDFPPFKHKEQNATQQFGDFIGTSIASSSKCTRFAALPLPSPASIPLSQGQNASRAGADKVNNTAHLRSSPRPKARHRPLGRPGFTAVAATPMSSISCRTRLTEFGPRFLCRPPRGNAANSQNWGSPAQRSRPQIAGYWSDSGSGAARTSRRVCATICCFCCGV